MKRMKLVMIGNGMAGVRTLEELLKIAPDHYDITVFGAEPHANYNRILLSPVLAGEMTLKEIMLNDVDWYEQHGIRLHLGKKVTKIERGSRKVVADDGTTEELRPPAAGDRFQSFHRPDPRCRSARRDHLPRYRRYRSDDSRPPPATGTPSSSAAGCSAWRPRTD